ncbi:MAG: hypothetical protein WA461_12530 [Nitrososphaeraceae archaeon]
MHEGEIEIEIDIIDDDLKWVDRIGKTAYDICSELNRNSIKLNGQRTSLIIESNDSAALGCIGWAIEQHLDTIPSKLKPKFQKILEDVKARKADLERS